MLRSSKGDARGTGKQRGKRHPTIGSHVVVGAAPRCWTITIGDFVKIGANSVVLQNVPDHSTVVGIPGRIVRIKDERVADDALMDHIHIPDPIADKFIELQVQIDTLKKDFERLREQNNRRVKRLDELRSRFPPRSYRVISRAYFSSTIL